LKAMRREDKLPNTSISTFLRCYTVATLTHQKTRKFKLYPMMEKCCGYQIKLATIPVSDMQRGVPLNLYFQFSNIIPIVVDVGSCYRPVVLMSPKMLNIFQDGRLALISTTFVVR